MFYIFIPLVVIAVSVLGGLLTSGGMAWYQTLILPTIAPAGSVIGTVWTVIFILCAVAAIWFWRKKKSVSAGGGAVTVKNSARLANWTVALLIVNAILNIGWSWVFFNQQLLGWAIVEMVVLNLSNLALIILFWKKYRFAAYLWMPYFLWVSFATYLAVNIWLLNG